MKKSPIATDDGADIQIDPSSDVGQLIMLLEYARARGFQVGPTVQIGSVIAQVRDLRQVDPEGRGRAAANALPIFERYGHRDE